MNFKVAVGFISKERQKKKINKWMAGGRELRWPELQIFDNMVSSGCVCLPIGSKQSRHDNAPILNQNAASVICLNRTYISSCNAPLPGFALGIIESVSSRYREAASM